MLTDEPRRVYHASPPSLKVDASFGPKEWAIQIDAAGMIISIAVAPALEAKARELFLGELPAVDHRVLLVKLLSSSLAGNTVRNYSACEGFTDTEWVELQRLAEEAGR